MKTIYCNITIFYIFVEGLFFLLDNNIVRRRYIYKKKITIINFSFYRVFSKIFVNNFT